MAIRLFIAFFKNFTSLKNLLHSTVKFSKQISGAPELVSVNNLTKKLYILLSKVPLNAPFFPEERKVCNTRNIFSFGLNLWSLDLFDF